MKRGTSIAGLVVFGLGAVLAALVTLDALLVMADCAGTACDAAKAGAGRSGFVALVMVSMGALAWKSLRGPRDA